MKLLARFRLWLHEDVSLCSHCLAHNLCETRLYLRRRAGLRALTPVPKESLWL